MERGEEELSKKKRSKSVLCCERRRQTHTNKCWDEDSMVSKRSAAFICYQSTFFKGCTWSSANVAGGAPVSVSLVAVR